MKITARGSFLIVICGLVNLFPVLRAELTAAQRMQAQESAGMLAAGRVAEADKLRPAEASSTDLAEWLERRGRWLLRDERLGEAKKDFLAAKNLTPNSFPVAAGLAEVALRLGQKAEAKALIKAVAELRKEEDPNQFFYGTDPGIPHLFLLQEELNSGGVTENTVDVFPLGEALPDALLMAARSAAQEGNVGAARDLSTRAIAEAGGKFPAAERFRQTVLTAWAQAIAAEPGSPELGRLRFFAEAQLAKGAAYNAMRAALEALKQGRDLPTFGARQLLFARAAAAVVLKDEPGPMKISDVNADTLEATRIFASVPQPDAAAITAEASLLARLRKIDPLWPAGTLPAPAKLAAGSPLRQALTVEPLRSGSDRVATLEKAFLAQWGGGPTAVDLETAEERQRWGEIAREGALIAHLRWLTLPADSSEATKARTDARQRTILALLCVPEDTAAVLVAKRHAWFNELDGQADVTGKPGAFTQKLKLLLAGKQGNYSKPPENCEELSALLTEVMPLAEGMTDLPTAYPGIAAAVVGRVTDVVGRLRLKRKEDVIFIASPMAEFVWAWTKDPARAQDVTDWGDAQVRYAFRAPAGLEKTPLSRYVQQLDHWLWNGAQPKAEPVTPAPWAKVPSVVWRHALGSSASPGEFKRLMEANRSGARGLSLSISSSVGQAILLMDTRLGNKMVAPIDGPAATELLSALAEIEAMSQEPGVMPVVRTLLREQLDLHRTQVLMASGQRDLAYKELPGTVVELETRAARAARDAEANEGALLVEILPQDPKQLAQRARLEQKELEQQLAQRTADEARRHPTVLVATKCEKCKGTGQVYNSKGGTGTNTYLQLGGTGLTYQRSYNTNYGQCPDCGGRGVIEHWELK